MQSLTLLKNAAGLEWQLKPLGFNVARAVSTTFSSLTELEVNYPLNLSDCLEKTSMTARSSTELQQQGPGFTLYIGVATSVVFSTLLFQRGQDGESGPP